MARGHERAVGDQVHSPNPRAFAGSPLSLAEAPAFLHELVIDTVGVGNGPRVYVAHGLLATDWVQQVGRPLVNKVYSFPTSNRSQIDPGAPPNKDLSTRCYPDVAMFSVTPGGAGNGDSLLGEMLEDFGVSTYLAVRKPSTEGGFDSFRLHYSVPNGFKTWAANGIRIRTRYVSTGAPSVPGGLGVRFELEAMDPTTGTPIPGALAVRTLAYTAIEAVSTELVLTPAMLLGFINPLDLLTIECRFGYDGANAAATSPEARWGRLELDLGG